MELLLLLFLAWFIGYVAGAAATVSKLKTMLGDASDSVNKTNLKKQEIPILITEKHGDMLYLFEQGTDNFMCQGTSLEDLMTKLSEYKDIHHAFVEHNKKGFWFINGEIVEHPHEG